MKKHLLPLCVLALAVLLVSCRFKSAEDPVPPETEGPLLLERLSVEVSKGSLSTQTLAQTVRELPGIMKEALAAHGVEVETVTISVGSAPAATVQAVSEGGVDLAFLPASDLAALDTPVSLILASGPAAGEEHQPGAPVLICAAPTDSGKALAEKELSWEELSQAHWGLLAEDSLLGHQAVDLWLSDNYGKTTAQLERAMVYDSYESLLRAAAAEEIDILPLWEGPRRDWAEAWTMDASKTDSRGVRGLERPAPLEEELPVLGTTERFYTSAAIVRPNAEALEGEDFAAALAAAVNDLAPENPVFGPYAYAPVDGSALDTQRRLANLG